MVKCQQLADISHEHRSDWLTLNSRFSSIHSPNRMASETLAPVNSSPLTATKAHASRLDVACSASPPRTSPRHNSPVLRSCSARPSTPNVTAQEKGQALKWTWIRRARSALAFVVSLQVSSAGRGKRREKGREMAPLSAISSIVPRDPIVNESFQGKRLPGGGGARRPPVLWI